MIERWCGICKQQTEQSYIEKSGKWSCNICKNEMEDALGCKVSFIVKGTPQPKERPRATIRGSYATIYTPKNTVQFERYVKQVASEYTPPKLLSGALFMTLSFYLQRPQSLSSTIIYDTKRPDVDNLAKSIMDALEGVIYEHDAQVIHLVVAKSYGTPRVEIIIMEMPEK